MLRTALLRVARPPRLAPQAVRWASSTLNPTTSSGPGLTTGVDRPLPVGEELDPQLNGYPQLPYVSLQKREAFGWWDQQERKNFGEVVHEEEDVLGMWGPDVHKISGPSALAQLALAFAGIGLFAYVAAELRPLRPVAARTYPYDGLDKELGGHVKARPEEVEDDE